MRRQGLAGRRGLTASDRQLKSKLIADKRAVLLYELGLNEEDKKEILKEIAREIIKE